MRLLPAIQADLVGAATPGTLFVETLQSARVFTCSKFPLPGALVNEGPLRRWSWRVGRARRRARSR